MSFKGGFLVINLIVLTAELPAGYPRSHHRDISAPKMMDLNILIQFSPKHTKLKLVLGPNLIFIEDLPEFQVLN